MPRGTELKESEIREIWRLNGTGASINNISKVIKRSRCAVRNVLKRGINGSVIKRSGRIPCLSSRDRRHVLSLATQNKMTSTGIKNALKLNCSTRTIRRVLHNASYVKFKKLKKKPPLLRRHKMDRLNFAKQSMAWTSKWYSVLFSDEKKFNLDGPDGFHYYWHDLRKSPDVLMSRQMGGGSVMVWAGFSAQGKTDIVFVHSRMNSEKYKNLLKDQLATYGELLCGENYTFQHDNAPIHASHATKKWLSEQSINVLPWPSRSPDLNPIENLWGILARAVYRNGRQFICVEDLKNAVKRAWEELSCDILLQLIESMPNRIFNVIKNNGGSTKY